MISISRLLFYLNDINPSTTVISQWYQSVDYCFISMISISRLLLYTNNRRNRGKVNTVSTHMHERSISWLRYRQSGRIKLVLHCICLELEKKHHPNIVRSFLVNCCADWDIAVVDWFSYIMATSFNGGRSRSTRRKPPTMGKQLVNFITCGCESSDKV
jgi:hypothetical protein